ncbi:MAG: hypothetical protein LUQ19_00335 [Methanoregula sp.]|nr:hypothetical protein [Methanoregula sp.]
MQDPSDLSKNNRSLRSEVLTILMLIVTLCFLLTPVTAHAPTNITIAYNPDMHKLFVTVTHPVDDPTTHYVRGVHVKLNGDVISDPSYKSQPAKNTFTYTYDVAAHPGDTVWVIATCVNGQSLEEHYDIVKPVSLTTTVQTLPPATATPPPSTAALPTTRTTHAAAGLLPLFGAAAVLLIKRN